LRAELEAEALAAGRNDINSWILSTRVGKPPRPHRVAKTFRKVLVVAGLPHFRLYDLRHTYASHLIAEHADIAYVAKQLGHAKMTTTLLHYGHCSRRAIGTTSSRWRPSGPRRSR
jgi:integrase